MKFKAFVICIIIYCGIICLLTAFESSRNSLNENLTLFVMYFQQAFRLL